MPQSIWNKDTIQQLFERPFFKLLCDAHACHAQHFDSQAIELCALLSIKTGACPEDCAYCPQSGHYQTGVEKEKLLDLEQVIEQARIAQQHGAQRFCLGAAWRSPPKKQFAKVLEMIKAIKQMGMETCVTLGMLSDEQAQALKQAGLDYYNHNLDTSPDYYPEIITTRCYQDRLDTLARVMAAGINVCCGGILGLGETRADRIGLLLALSELPQAPRSIPINQLIPIEHTPLENQATLDCFEFIRTIAVARLMFPESKIRLSAGREQMSEPMQAWCFMAGANSIFIGDRLLTAANPEAQHDKQLFEKLNLHAELAC